MSTAALVERDNTSLDRLKTWPARLALGCGSVFLIVLFAVWPYQHWAYEHRDSVLRGWWTVLNEKSNAEWQYCLLVPAITAWLVHRQREELRLLPLRGTWWGAAVLVASVFFYWMGFKVDTGYLGYASIQLSLAGMVLLLGGPAWMRALLLPWLFLAFAWPFFPLENLLAARLKIPTAEIAAKVLSLLGVDVVRDGSTLRSAADAAAQAPAGARFTLDVADSCSGMRSLYALIMTGVLYSIIALKRTGPRLILAASAIPLAVAGNVVRLLLLAFGSVLFGQDFAVGRQVDGHQEESAFHLLAGFLVFGVALGGMFALASVLERRGGRKKGPVAKAGKMAAPGTPPDAALRSVITRSVALLALGASGILLCWTTPASVEYASPGMRMDLPSTVGDYAGQQHGMTAKESAVFDAGVQLDRRQYISPGRRPITATVVLSGTVKKTLHTPEVCLPDQGWRVSSNDVIPLQLPDGRTMEASLMQAVREVDVGSGQRVRVKAMHLYWYQGSKGVSTPSYFMHNFISYRDAIFRNLNHRWTQASLFLIVSEQLVGAPAPPMEDFACMDELRSFAAGLIPQVVLVE